MKLLKPFLIAVLLASTTLLFGQNIEGEKIKSRLLELFPTAKIIPIENLEGYSQSFEIILNQLLDHKNPKKGTFEHHIYLSHSDFNKPMIIETEGYAARYVKNEVSNLLNANQVVVEYRFYGKSRPNPVPWEFLTNDQAIEDYHYIVGLLKKLYKNKWISTGISKGGETTLIYKSKYPNDVTIAIPYVAPLIDTQEDIRTTNHINSVGTKECREKVRNFQRALLLNREAIIAEIKNYATEKNMTFEEVTIEEALEYAALEFSFSFWQWSGKCEDIPDNSASPKELFDYMNAIVGISFYNDETYHNLLPSYYQHIRELGYYGFDFTPVEDLLQIVKSTSNKRFAPKDVNLDYNPKYIKEVRKFVETKGNKILYIYGGYDTWGACSPTPKENLDALKMVLPTGTHRTRIKHFPKADQEKIMATLERWMSAK
ncbi:MULTISPECIES: S28 family serine protease [Flavobacterium]|uniref:S28 family serine protease n=1 Tax=Flavobacterium jumunjinense TaxID=998845 RepID=A0ABV5GL97_9FLAO|nr:MULTISPECIES: S28 family serine protease [Flavobacterium]